MSTFQSCGSSSSEVLRSSRPTGVMRGSFLSFWVLVPLGAGGRIGGEVLLEPPVGVHHHGAQLPDAEHPAVAADPVLAVEAPGRRRARIIRPKSRTTGSTKGANSTTARKSKLRLRNRR